jgi:hypothetical protein
VRASRGDDAIHRRHRLVRSRLGEEEFISIAEADRGRLVGLDNGFTRQQAVEYVLTLARPRRERVVGLDFTFSFPRWFFYADLALEREKTPPHARPAKPPETWSLQARNPSNRAGSPIGGRDAALFHITGICGRSFVGLGTN